jgi:hypothetical protein
MVDNNYSLSDIAAVTDGNRNNGMWGGDWFGYILLFALLGGGFGGFGGFGAGGILPWLLFGNGGFGGGCGNPATQADLAAGFNNSAVLASLNDIKLGQANAINYNNQGFNGLNTALLQGFNGVERGFCDISHQLSDCCCATQRAIDGVNYNLATQTRDVIENANANSRAILDFLTNDKITTLTAENQALKFQASQSAQNAFITANQEAQTAELIRRLGRDCPVPAYVVPNPNCCYGNPYGVGFNNNGCGCNGGF